MRLVNISAILAESLRAMGMNRMRTALAMLGMVIGVAAVVLMLAVGRGAQLTVEQSIASMGSNLFIVLSGSSTSGGLRIGAGTIPTLTLNDAEAIAQLPSVKAVAPIYQGSAQMVYGANNWSTLVYGSMPAYFDVRGWSFEAGHSFDQSDVRGATRVVVLGRTVAQNLFGDEDPIGKMVRIKNSPFRVVGLLEAKGQSLDGRDQDDTAMIPVTTAQRKLFGNPFPGTVRYISVQAVSREAMTDAEREMTQLLRQRHRLSERAENDFTIRNLTASAQAEAASAQAMSFMLGAIASISLLVGGIGIMNIMLVSVTERTREIGIRMAIGARRRDILTQFLLEAVILCVAGGLIGVLLGVGGAWLLSALAGMTAVVTLGSILLSFAFAAGIGIFFGLYPARRGAGLSPVEALRYE
ncbi:MAG: ABC transporter permease [Hydrogenophilaceae bacterium]|nr:ABC transporter permease [Hydrogenophilaceae bacterium]